MGTSSLEVMQSIWTHGEHLPQSAAERQYANRGRQPMISELWKFGIPACVVMLVAGCNSNGRQSPRGAVTLDGTLLESGVIKFIPQPGTNGPSAGGLIEAGQFSVASGKGVFPGSYRVEITSIHKTGRKIRTT